MIEGLTEQQRKWFASVRSGLEAATGRSLADWAAVAATCPEATPRARQRWLKEQHGLGQNHAALIFREVEQRAGAAPRDAAALRDALWSDPVARAILAAIDAAVADLPDLVRSQRKGFTAWSRRHAFAAARPHRGAVRVGLAVPPDADPRLAPGAREGWSERLTAALVLDGPDAVDASLAALLRGAHGRS